MKKYTPLLSAGLGLLACLLLPTTAMAEAVVGKPAPAFSAPDAEGKSHSLADYQGQWLVLEWFNKDCPYVKKHYGSSNMQNLQAKYADKVQWLTIVSSAEGKQGYLSAEAAQQVIAEQKLASVALLLDSDGVVGKAYGAKTTPHIFIINPKGDVVYAGAIDDNDSASPAVIATSKNYVAAALDEALAGKPITTSSTRPYGCGVKY